MTDSSPFKDRVDPPEDSEASAQQPTPVESLPKPPQRDSNQANDRTTPFQGSTLQPEMQPVAKEELDTDRDAAGSLPTLGKAQSPALPPSAPPDPNDSGATAGRTFSRETRAPSRFDDPLYDADKRDFPWQKTLFWVTGGLVLALALGALSIIVVIEQYSKDLPDVRQLEQGYAPPQVTRVLSRDGTLLSNIFSERRTVVPYERIPDHVKSAFLAAEDANFFEHEGLDYFGLLRALVANVRAGRVKQGGSTITQQVVKNILLDSERSYRRKIRETILAYRLEKTLDKEQILGMYLNHIYLGHGRYGVEEAGRFYFGKHVEELDIPEAALLAGIVAAPERYSPRKIEEKARVRRRYVLSQMLKKGFMTEQVFDAAAEEPIRLAPVAETESDIAPEMVQHATGLLQELVGASAGQGGYTIVTTIDPALQVAARQALREGLDEYLKRQKLAPPFTLEKRRLWGKAFEGKPHKHGIYVGTVVQRDDANRSISVQVGDVLGVVALEEEKRFNPDHVLPTNFVGPDAALRVRVIDDPENATEALPVRLRLELGPQAALVAMDPQTFEVLAAVGNYEALPGGLDRSYQTKRQPGSTFKPLVYSYALNTHQVTAATRFEFPATEKVENEAGELIEQETIESLSLREGVARSDNRVAREVLRRVGASQAVQWAKTLGITSHLEPTESLMLGAYEVTVTEMAAAFAVFASGGVARTPTFIKKVESGAGDLPLPPQPPERRVMDPAVAYLTTSLLSSVISEGTGKRARSLERPLAGKTGTTNRAKDAWFIGYSTDLVVAVWVGYDDALPLGWGESGATTALPIWMNMMKAAHRGKPATEFPRPGDIVEAELDPGTGLRSRFGQEETVTELFLPGTVPEEIAPEQVDEEPDSSEDKEHQAQGPELETDDDSALRDPELPPEAPNDEDVSLPPPGEEPPPF